MPRPSSSSPFSPSPQPHQRRLPRPLPPSSSPSSAAHQYLPSPSSSPSPCPSSSPSFSFSPSPRPQRPPRASAPRPSIDAPPAGVPNTLADRTMLRKLGTTMAETQEAIAAIAPTQPDPADADVDTDTSDDLSASPASRARAQEDDYVAATEEGYAVLEHPRLVGQWALASRPVHFVWFAIHFDGTHGFFSHLALFRHHHPRPEIPPTALRLLHKLIEAQALMRIAEVRSVELCAFCKSADAPFCAVVPPGVRPAAANQHANSESHRCILEHTLHSLKPTPARIRQVFASIDGTVRVQRDTDDRTKPMQMLALYARTIWHSAATLRSLAFVIRIALKEHGLVNVQPPPRDLRRIQELKSELLRLADSAGDGLAGDELDECAELHAHMFAADWADLAMQLVILALAQSSTASRAQPMPERWLIQVANDLHADYEPEVYHSRRPPRTAPQQQQQQQQQQVHVSRDHTLAKELLQRWIQRLDQPAPLDQPVELDESEAWVGFDPDDEGNEPDEAAPSSGTVARRRRCGCVSARCVAVVLLVLLVLFGVGVGLLKYGARRGRRIESDHFVHMGFQHLEQGRHSHF